MKFANKVGVSLFILFVVFGWASIAVAGLGYAMSTCFTFLALSLLSMLLSVCAFSVATLEEEYNK